MVAVTHTILLRGGTVLFHDDQDHVQQLRGTDILVQGKLIKQIGPNIEAPKGAEVVDCTDKIISPGFVDTHHHLWQSQLKGTHADQSLFDYVPTGYWQSHVFTADDIFIGQLAGALEAIDTGTTFVLDHAHGNQTTEHANMALSATVASGIRSIFAYAHPPFFTKWDSQSCELSGDMIPESSIRHIHELAAKQPHGDGRVHIGFGFDFWFLPKDAIVGLFSSLRAAGVKLFTSHYVRNAAINSVPIIKLLGDYELLQSPPDIVLSHATNLSNQEKDELIRTQVAVSSTPDTEAQMGFGWPLAFEPGINTTIGVDCHTNNTSSILSLARSGLQLARQKEAVEELGDGGSGGMHLHPRGSTEIAFNAATINGARAMLSGDSVGSIREGKLADLVIFDATSPAMSCVAESDALTAVMRHSDVRDAEAVMINGEWRKRGGKLEPVVVEETQEKLTWPEIRERLHRSMKAIRQRQDQLNFGKAKEALIGAYFIDKQKLLDSDN